MHHAAVTSAIRRRYFRVVEEQNHSLLPIVGITLWSPVRCTAAWRDTPVNVPLAATARNCRGRILKINSRKPCLGIGSCRRRHSSIPGDIEGQQFAAACRSMWVGQSRQTSRCRRPLYYRALPGPSRPVPCQQAAVTVGLYTPPIHRCPTHGVVWL